MGDEDDLKAIVVDSKFLVSDENSTQKKNCGYCKTTIR